MPKRIAVLSDTHGLLRPEVLTAIDGCDAIIHGGDINKPEIIERLQEIAPVYVVRGNNDKAWADHIPATLTFQIEDCRFFLVHNKKEVPKDLTGIDAVIFGHSHKYFEQIIDGRLWLNPGSCGKRRFDQEITLAILTVDGGTLSAHDKGKPLPIVAMPEHGIGRRLRPGVFPLGTVDFRDIAFQFRPVHSASSSSASR